MIKDIWNNTKVYCGNHDDAVEMKLVQHGGIFAYECPDKTCGNEISSLDFEKLIDNISERIESGYMMQNVKGFSCKIRGHLCSVSEHKKDNLKVTIK